MKYKGSRPRNQENFSFFVQVFELYLVSQSL